jgi:uncharacterized OB-fold protein
MTAEVWMGYLVDEHSDFTVVQSPFVQEKRRVFGADSDATTLAVAAVLHRIRAGPLGVLSVPDGIDASTVQVATGVTLLQDDSEHDSDWDLLLSDEATVVLAKCDADVELAQLDVFVEVDDEFNDAIEAAWAAELASHHVSQGAYVSQSQYAEAARSRLSLEGLRLGSNIQWPPRFSGPVDGEEHEAHHLTRTGTIQSWTTLSAAGAPSEFALRAPLLGGISTVFVQLDDGPKGVFLVVDDEDATLEMDAPIELVLRRVYAQEGFIRYGLKARSISS